MKHIKDFMSKPREILKVFLYTILATLVVLHTKVVVDVLLILGKSALLTFVLLYFGYCLENNKWLNFKELWRKMK